MLVQLQDELAEVATEIECTDVDSDPLYHAQLTEAYSNMEETYIYLFL